MMDNTVFSINVSQSFYSHTGRIGLRAVVYYMTTTFAAVILGIILVLIIRPGSRGNDITRVGESKEQEPLEALFDLIR